VIIFLLLWNWRINICTRLFIQVLYSAKICGNSKTGTPLNKGNNKITDLRAILQRESQNS
jgi:hypothetical protein